MLKFSQNFLVNHAVLPSIIEAADLNSDDVVLEIGPGKGILTKQLCPRVAEVIAIEIDQSLMSGLNNLENDFSNLHVFNADFNSFNWQAVIAERPFKIVANIPYHITGLIIRNIFNHKFHLPSKVVLMVQWEVAKKMAARDDNQNILSNLIRQFGDISIVQKVPKTAFRPVPKIDSAIILIDNIHQPDIDNPEKFLSFIKIGFSSRRKTLLNNFAAGLDIPKSNIAIILSSCSIEPSRRAQTLTQSEWKKLYLKMSK